LADLPAFGEEAKQSQMLDIRFFNSPVVPIIRTKTGFGRSREHNNRRICADIGENRLREDKP